MSTFPKREAEAVALADEMIAGYLANPGDFPRTDVAVLQTVRTEYGAAKDAQIAAEAAAARAVETKAKKFEALKKIMTREIRNSELDAADAPEKLERIGWKPRAARTPIQRPGQPRDLHVLSQEPQTIHLKWKRSANHSGGATRAYRIQRREMEDGNMNEWHTVGSIFKTEAQLDKQPSGIAIEYQIIAINSRGQSDPSNTIAAIL